MKKIKVGLFGLKYHQVYTQVAKNPDAEWIAAGAYEGKKVPPGAKVYDTFDQMLADKDIELISLCSPKRSEQASQAVRAMKAGKHVYAEKPCALTEPDLDLIIKTAQETGMQFHEMAGVAFHQPYFKMREIVKSGVIGNVVQVLGQKCYPWTERRPADENVDGGLGTQVAIYLTRFVEHVACVRIASAEMLETKYMNPVPGSQCRMAVSLQMSLANGGLACGVANYLNPMGKKIWGYDILRVFGTKGLVESDPEAGTARLILQGKEPEILDTKTECPDYFDMYIQSLLGLGKMPLTMEEELSPVRWIIRAKNSAKVITD